MPLFTRLLLKAGATYRPSISAALICLATAFDEIPAPLTITR
jgi:hypothetical protein